MRLPLSGPLRRGPALVLALAALALPTSQAAAQTYRWDDGGAATNRNWDNPSNWFNITAGTNDGVPPPTADVQFGIGYTAPITVNLNGDRTVNSLAFGEPLGSTAPAKASYVPLYAHLALVLGAGLYLPPPLVAWFQYVAGRLG